MLDLAIMRPFRGKAALHFAVLHQNNDMVQLLLESGANPQPPMTEDITPLHIAAAKGWVLGVETLVRRQPGGLSLYSRDAFLYETPLHKVARNRHVASINRLTAMGADRQARNVDGKLCRETLELSLADPGQ